MSNTNKKEQKSNTNSLNINASAGERRATANSV